MAERHTTDVLAYHFTNDTLRDGRPIPAIGVKLEHEGYVVICESGLHASEHPFDALLYAPGSLLHRVVMRDVVDRQDDKLVARERTILATIDATELLREFARWCALQVIDRWNAPAVVREYLETGDEALRAEAHSAAWDARRAGPWDVAEVARTASLAVSRDTSRAEVWAATRDAVSAASVAVLWSTQRERFAEMVEAAFAAE